MEWLDVEPQPNGRTCQRGRAASFPDVVLQGVRIVRTEVRDPGGVMPEHAGQLALKMVLSGEGCCCFEFKRYRVNPGHVLVVPPHVQHITSFNTPATLLVAYVSDYALRYAMGEFSQTNGQFDGYSEELFDFPAHLRLAQSKIAEALNAHASPGDSLGAEELRVQVAALAADLVLDACIATRRITASRRTARHELFRRVCIARAVIESEPLSASSLATLASTAALSPFHLLRTFAQAFGETPAQMRRRLLMENAKALLSESHLSIGEVASATGFESHAAFCRAFRRATGCAPTAFRSRFSRSQERANTDGLMKQIN
jgi:AraC-like DNA-binding protein